MTIERWEDKHAAELDHEVVSIDVQCRWMDEELKALRLAYTDNALAIAGQNHIINDLQETNKTLNAGLKSLNYQLPVGSVTASSFRGLVNLEWMESVTIPEGTNHLYFKAGAAGETLAWMGVRQGMKLLTSSPEIAKERPDQYTIELVAKSVWP